MNQVAIPHAGASDLRQSPSLQTRFAQALTLDDFIASAEANADLWRALARRAVVPQTLRAAVQSVAGRWHLLVLVEDWCGDAVNSLPYVQALANTAPAIDMRILSRDANPDLMDAHLSPTGGRAIPVVIVLDEHYVERCWWGSRPRELQRWIHTDGAHLSKDDRYSEARKWYARDRGASIIAELLALLS